MTVHSASRQVLWDKADFQHINDLMLQHASNFVTANSSDTSIEQLWSAFKFICSDCMKLVPYKHLLRGNLKLHGSLLTSNTSQEIIIIKPVQVLNLASDWSAYSDFKKYTEHECRRTCNHYLKHLILAKVINVHGLIIITSIRCLNMWL